ncbi:MAG TPA: hypothetical protein VKB80_37175 [Kofleriaceae bacterium]|nr:hypothetical protein [Kofleriaceae bacterium]
MVWPAAVTVLGNAYNRKGEPARALPPLDEARAVENAAGIEAAEKWLAAHHAGQRPGRARATRRRAAP